MHIVVCASIGDAIAQERRLFLVLVEHALHHHELLEPPEVVEVIGVVVGGRVCGTRPEAAIAGPTVASQSR